jgi:adenine specific DNA methylase Mod
MQPRGDAERRCLSSSGVLGAAHEQAIFRHNLYVLREKIKDESVDLVYLDPPFNSRANYNLLFKTPSGQESEAQAEAFRDTWEWGKSARDAFEDVIAANGDVALVLSGLRKWLGENAMIAYLAMMAARLIELRRVLKPTGSLYLHCDPTASHYLKLLLDSIFGHDNFRNEIVWKRKSGRGETNKEPKKFGATTDTILYYVNSNLAPFFKLHRPNDEKYIAAKFTHAEADGRIYRLADLSSPSFRPNLRYEYKGYEPPDKGWAVSKDTMRRMEDEGRLYFPDDKTKRIQRKRFFDELRGENVDSLWDDIPPVNPMAKERLGYPTQKPVELLERIIQASSRESDVVLDPFCGCGTTIEAAERLKRQLVGIDVTHYAVTLIEGRLRKLGVPENAYQIAGRPTVLAEARELARRDKHQFQWWASWRLGAQIYREEKRGADRGIDGNIFFRNGPYGIGRIIVSVKAGENVGVQMIRDLRGVIEREEAEMGVFVTLAEPTGPMQTEADGSGYVRKSAHGRMPRIQIVTIDNLLANRLPKLPPLPQPVQKISMARRRQHPDQLELLLPFEGAAIRAAAGEFIDPRFDPRLVAAE